MAMADFPCGLEADQKRVGRVVVDLERGQFATSLHTSPKHGDGIASHG